MEHAGRLLLERGYQIDISYSSRLKRAIRSNWIMLRELNQIFRPVFKSYRLNERMYGALEGMSKPGLARELGKEAVISYRSSLHARPPPMNPDHPHWHGNEKKYADLDPKELPVTESLEDCMKRSLPLWESKIKPDLKKGLNVLIVAHGNSLRGIVKHIDQLTPEQIKVVGIPNGIPLVYKFDQHMRPVPQNGSEFPLTGEYLEKKGLLRNALELENELSQKIPGYDLFDANITGFEKMIRYAPPLDPRLSSLFRLDKQRMLYTNTTNSTSSSIKSEAAFDNDDGAPDTENVEIVAPAGIQRASGSDSGTDSDSGSDSGSDSRAASSTKNAPAIIDRDGQYPRVHLLRGDANVRPKKPVSIGVNRPDPTMLDDGTAKSISRPLLVIIRHGKTEHNKLGLFTGWEDAPLAAEGRSEAREAGQLLRAHGLSFDIVYTSWLSRAIETAWLVLNELDALWLPLIKTWRLNERMYGALTGLSKKMIGQRHGDTQLKQWRRSYATRPPKVSSFSQFYPGNDDRYVKFVRDMPISYFETAIRSLAECRWQIHRKFPKTESLKDCMERTIPYYRDTIKPNSIDLGKSVLVASSENAIRGLLMHLCEIPPERISEVEIPTGLPLVFDLRKKCIKLLDDGKGGDLLSKYNFGSSPELLFRPCDIGDDDEINGLMEVDAVLNSGRNCYVDPQGRLFAYDPILRLPDKEEEEDEWEHFPFDFPDGEGSFDSSAESALL